MVPGRLARPVTPGAGGGGDSRTGPGLHGGTLSRLPPGEAAPILLETGLVRGGEVGPLTLIGGSRQEGYNWRGARECVFQGFEWKAYPCIARTRCGETFTPREGDPASFLGSRVKGRRCPSGEKGTSWEGGILTWPGLEWEPP